VGLIHVGYQSHLGWDWSVFHWIKRDPSHLGWDWFTPRFIVLYAEIATLLLSILSGIGLIHATFHSLVCRNCYITVLISWNRVWVPPLIFAHYMLSISMEGIDYCSTGMCRTITEGGTLKGTIHIRSMTWHISCHGEVNRISALLEHKHLESMTWHISCHGVIKRSITVLVHQLAGTAHMRSMTWHKIVMVWYGIYHCSGSPACWHCSYRSMTWHISCQWYVWFFQ
jgi:hypothetical protein